MTEGALGAVVVGMWIPNQAALQAGVTVGSVLPVPAQGNGNSNLRLLDVSAVMPATQVMWVQLGVPLSAQAQLGSPVFLSGTQMAYAQPAPLPGTFQTVPTAANVFVTPTFGFSPNNPFVGIIVGLFRPDGVTFGQAWDYGYIQIQGPNMVPMNAGGVIPQNALIFPSATGVVSDATGSQTNTNNACGRCLQAIAGPGTANIPAGAVFLTSPNFF